MNPSSSLPGAAAVSTSIGEHWDSWTQFLIGEERADTSTLLDLMLFSPLILFTQHWRKDGKQALEPLNVPQGRMFWTSIYSDGRFFFVLHVLSHKRLARETPWERQKKSFLWRQPNNSLPVCAEACEEVLPAPARWHKGIGSNRGINLKTTGWKLKNTT